MGVPVAAAEQDRRGLPARASTGSSAATSTSSSTRPPASGARTDGWEIRRAAVAPRHPLPDDARRRRLGRARDRPARAATASPRCSACRSCTAPSAASPRRDARRAARPDGARGGVSAAPFGTARARASPACEELGAYRVLRVADPDGPAPAPGSSRCSPPSSAGAGGRTSGPSCRAPSRSPAARDGECAVPARGRRPGHHAPVRAARRASELWVLGPLGRGFRRPPDGRRALLVGGGVGIAPLAILQDALAGAAPPCCSASATAPAPQGAALLAGAQRRHRRRLGRPPRPRHRAARSASSTRDAARGRLRLRARRRCSRPCARSAASARGARPARARGGHGLRLRRLLRLRRAPPRRRLPARVRRRPGDRRRASSSASTAHAGAPA